MSELSKYIYKGLKKINEITQNIDLEKTSENYISLQLKQLENNFQKLEINENYDENFFQFLNKNETKIKNLKVYVFNSSNPISLELLLHDYFSNINEKINEDKMFYFYFNLVLIEMFLKDNNQNFARKDLKNQLKEFLKNSCTKEKFDLSKCLNENKSNIDIIPMSDLSHKINQKCQIQRNNFEKCVINNFKKN